MIDGRLLLRSAFWISGLALVLAAFSYHVWQAGVASRSLRDQLRRRSWKLAGSAGSLLVCAGLALSPGSPGWERIAWVLFAVAFARQGVNALGRR
jgi:hypothetical protein